jgi:hypothetical protein
VYISCRWDFLLRISSLIQIFSQSVCRIEMLLSLWCRCNAFMSALAGAFVYAGVCCCTCLCRALHIHAFLTATGIEEHNSYGVAFINATRRIKVGGCGCCVITVHAEARNTGIVPILQDFRRCFQLVLRIQGAERHTRKHALCVPLPCC